MQCPTVKVRLKSTPCWNMRWQHQMLKRVLGGRSRHIKKAFTWRFVLDILKSRKFLNPVMNLATVDAPGVIFHNRTCIYKGIIVPIWVHYISYMYVNSAKWNLIRRGLWRCLFNWIRQCESLKMWDRQQAVPTSLFFCRLINWRIIRPTLGTVGT